MMSYTYYADQGGLPDQSRHIQDRAKFTESYAYIPREVMCDIVSSALPNWHDTRAWILARPLSGFAETFAQYIVHLGANGRVLQGEVDPQAQGVLFVLRGELRLTLGITQHDLCAGSYVYIPAGQVWGLSNQSDDARLVWIRKRYESLDNIPAPAPLICHENDVALTMMSNTDKWGTKRFVDPADLAHDMHVNLVEFQPDGIIPFNETHVMEHGIYILQGQATYRLNQDDYDVRAGDFIWLRAFSPQSCFATGDAPFRYLLYKDVNRHPKLAL